MSTCKSHGENRVWGLAGSAAWFATTILGPGSDDSELERVDEQVEHDLWHGMAVGRGQDSLWINVCLVLGRRSTRLERSFLLSSSA